MHDLVANQRSFFETHQTKPLSFRLRQLNHFEQVLKAHESRLLEAIHKDFKKSAFETMATELGLVYQELKLAKRQLKHWSRPKMVKTNWVNFPAKSYVIPEPLGVALIIGAWNYPYFLSLTPVIAAMAAGNTMILKPSELPSETSKAIQKMVLENFDATYFHVVEGGAATTSELLKQKFDKIFFTGSTQVGKLVYKAAAEHLTPVTLELGGKSPTFVTASCNLKMTVKRLVWGKFLNAGQTCVAPDYVLVHQSIETQFLEACKAEIEKSLYHIDRHNYVQIINNQHFERLVRLIDKGKVYLGGGANKAERFIEPTLLKGVTFEDAIMKEEVFGPLLPVIPYTDISEILEKVRLLPKPLACSIFTNNTQERQQILRELSFGGGTVNDTVMHLANPHLPFGGVGTSGLGSYHGEAGFKAFSHFKSILHKGNWLELPLKYTPLTSKKLWWIRQILKL